MDHYSSLFKIIHLCIVPCCSFKLKAKEIFQSDFGKTKAWYILEGRTVKGEDPYVLFGFKPEDVFFIEGGVPQGNSYLAASCE